MILSEEFERFRADMIAFMSETLENIENLLGRATELQNLITEAMERSHQLRRSSIDSDDENVSNEQCRCSKRRSDETVESESPNKIPKIDDEQCGSLIINLNMKKDEVIENLNKWLVQTYCRAAKFYCVEKSTPIGMFSLYVAIDVDLDDTKDDIHAVINSNHLHRPDEIFQFVENCFDERKVVTLLHIITDDEQQLRENPKRLAAIITSMMEPTVANL